MERQDLIENLAQTLAEVLEVQAFLFAEPVAPASLILPEGPGVRASISFVGASLNGSIELLCPQSLCGELAANILGVEAEEIESETDAEDALKEVLNIACGQFLTRCYGSGPVFTLSLPCLEPATTEEWKSWVGQAEVLGLEIEATPLLARLSLVAAG